MKPMKFSSRPKAEDALAEVLQHYPAGIVGCARNWKIEGHGYAHSGAARLRLNYFLGEDGRMHEYSRTEAPE